MQFRLRKVTSTIRPLVLVPVMPHHPKDEQLAVVIPSDITKRDRRTVELEFAKERPLRRQRIPGACDEIKARTDMGVRLPILGTGGKEQSVSHSAIGLKDLGQGRGPDVHVVS